MSVTYEEVQGKLLTTKDNPYNPRTDYELWRQWDAEHHYHTESYLARVADIPLDIDLDNDPLIMRLTNEAKIDIINNDTLNIYELV